MGLLDIVNEGARLRGRIEVEIEIIEVFQEQKSVSTETINLIKTVAEMLGKDTKSLDAINLELQKFGAK